MLWGARRGGGTRTFVAGGDIEVGAQGVVDELVVRGLAACGDDVMELCGRVSYGMRGGGGQA